MSLADWFADTKKYLDKNGLRLLSKLTEKRFRFKTMPVASEEYDGVIAEYIGTLTPDYTPGYFYRCQNTGTVAVPVWTWVQHDVQPNDDTPHFIGTQAQWDAHASEYPEGTIVGLIDEEDTTYEHGKYATVETVTGKRWIDGKPIYRKVVTTNSLPAGGSSAMMVPTGIAAGVIECVTKLQTIIYNPTGGNTPGAEDPNNCYWFDSSYVTGSSASVYTIDSYVHGGGTSIYLANTGTWPTFCKTWTILEYTKRAD